MMRDIKIIVATTKEYRMPDDPIYIPLQVGAALTDVRIDGSTPDNTGDNISDKNASYCELTGLYWAWKNISAEYVGLVHYRRYFESMDAAGEIEPFDRIIGGGELDEILETKAVIVPQKRRYYIESLGSHYAHTHYASHLEDTLKIIKRKYPEYEKTYERVLGRTYGYMFNMMILRRDCLDEYCRWLFDILGDLEILYADSSFDAYQGRYIGRVSEILFNVWLEYQLDSGRIKQSSVQELPYMHMEHINWIKKGWAFLAAKFFNKKYRRSF